MKPLNNDKKAHTERRKEKEEKKSKKKIKKLLTGV